MRLDPKGIIKISKGPNSIGGLADIDFGDPRINKMTFISEGNLNTLISRSDRPEAIEDLFPKLCQAMKQIMESAQSLLPEKDPVKLDRQLRTLGILPRQQPGLPPEQGPHMHVYKLSEELNASPDEAQEALDVLEALGYVAYHKLTPGAIPGYVLTF